MGWVNGKRPIICHGCYTINDHIIPQCLITITEIKKVVHNYEKLSADDKAGVPDMYYQIALPFVRVRPVYELTHDVKKKEQPKQS